MKTVYGLFIDTGSAEEMFWDRGVWATSEACEAYINQVMGHVTGIRIGELKINDAFPAAADEEDGMITCSLCGIDYNEADVNVLDYEEPVCVNCEPEYRQSLDMA
ncbi:hypothetical protein [Bacillus massilinigeriensis]|uniref:hypothetical protein n=1 Tax=Bacillus mediterraneensis TaxID=1805474 RepID=UPI0008F94741|nr:hypothetical protein [Bacillus mediterraneensis]